MTGPVDLKEFVSGFVAEAHELLRGVHANLLAVDAAVSRGEASPRAVRELFRALHTIKGLAGMIGVEPIVDLAHAMESVLRIAERAGGRLPQGAFDPLLEATQAIETRVSALEAGRAVVAAPTRIVDALAKAERGVPAVAHAPAAVEIDPALDEKLDASDRALLAGAASRGSTAYQLAFVPSPERSAAGIGITSVRERVASIADIVKIVPTSVRTATGTSLRFVLLVVSSASADALRAAAGIDASDVTILGATATTPAEPAAPDGERESALDGEDRAFGVQRGVVRVDVRRLDDAMEGLAELLVTRRRLTFAIDAVAAEGVDVRDLRQVAHDTARQLRDMRRAVVALRMVSVAELCEPLPLLVRGLTAAPGRSVKIELDLGRIEVDKAVGERLWPALVHLVRNAVDHGIEGVEARQARGKRTEARLVVRAIQRSNAVVEVSVADDGGGVDAVEASRRAGVPVPRDDIELLAILTRPGLSTRATADTTSGRGMGLDIVRNIVEGELGGELGLSTQRGVGTTFTLKVPVTIAVVDALAIEAAEQPFVVALGAIELLTEVDPRQVVSGPMSARARATAATMLRHGDAVVPMFDLAAALGVPSREGAALPKKALLVRRPRGVVAFGVDRMLGHHEIVVRPLQDPLVKSRGITGTTDLGDGKPTLVLDLGALADDRMGAGPDQPERAHRGNRAVQADPAKKGGRAA